MDEQGLEEMLLGGAPIYTQAEIAAKSGIDEEQARRIWRALGFPTPPEDERAFTAGDLDALRDIKAILDDDLVDEELVVHLSRAVGQTMGRMANWLNEVWMKRAAVDFDDDDAILHVVESTQELLPRFDRLLLHGWRRQLAASGLRVFSTATASTADPTAGTATLAVGFVDIVSFTRLSREMDSESLAAFVERFEVAAAENCAELGGRIVKTLGDEVLFTCDDPARAAEFVLRMTERHIADEGFPRVRAGLAYGELILRLGDVFGTPVNLAARLTSAAHPGTALIDQGMAIAVHGDAAFDTAPLRPRQLQGLGRVRPYVLRRP